MPGVSCIHLLTRSSRARRSTEPLRSGALQTRDARRLGVPRLHRIATRCGAHGMTRIGDRSRAEWLGLAEVAPCASGHDTLLVYRAAMASRTTHIPSRTVDISSLAEALGGLRTWPKGQRLPTAYKLL